MKVERQLAWPCRDCGVRGSSFCSTLIGASPSVTPVPSNEISQIFLQAEKHNVIQQSGEPNPSGTYVLCKGWAFRFVRFPDGRRQILSVLIPGDLFSAFALFDPNPAFSIQAATDVNVCQLGGDGVKKELTKNPNAYDMFGNLCSAEIDDMASTSLDLVEPHAATRIAGFTRRLVRRLAARGINNGAGTYPFPLTPVDIADATGLAPDDVNRAIDELRDNRVVDLSNDEITILDSARFDEQTLVTIR